MYPTKPLWEILDKNFSIWKIPVKEYLKEWTLPIIDQWKNFIWWYTNDYSQKYNWNLPVLVYWDHTNSVKFIDFDFTWWADGIKIFKFWEKIDTKYMFYVINYYKPENLWYRRHFSILKQIQIPLPSLQTQQKIVLKLDKIFENIDKNIELTKQNIANIDEENNAILEKIFTECEKEFRVEKLGEKIILNYGKSAEKSENWIFDVYGANGVMYKSEKFLFDGKSIIIWRKWSAGALNKVNWKFWASDVAYFVTSNEDIDYIFYVLKFLNLPLLARWVKPGINRNDVYNLKISIPPLPNQQKIVEKLDKIFAKNSELKNFYEKNLKNLEELKQSILKQAFEDENFIQ